jgi:cobaltochelatase CobN
MSMADLCRLWIKCRMSKSSAPSSARIRILVVAATAEDPAWAPWNVARDASPMAHRMVMQRVSRGGGQPSRNGAGFAVGLGYGEELRWFGPVENDETRARVIAYAERVLAERVFPDVGVELRDVWQVPASVGAARGRSAADARSAFGILLLSHAETDLLALARAREDLPQSPGFPSVASASLNGVTDASQLLQLCAPGYAAGAGHRVVIVRVHGAASSVPGLVALVTEADRAGRHVVVISGVGADPGLQPRSSGVSVELATSLSAYFMAGGVSNVAHALRRVAHDLLDIPVDCQPPQPMPAHGLYHPDLLVTNVAEWHSYRASATPLAVVLFYRAHVLSGNLQFVDQLVRSLEANGFSAVGVFTSSLRDRDDSGRPVALGLLQSPAVIVNTVSYPMLTLTSLEAPPDESRGGVFDAIGAPIIQAICGGSTRATWKAAGRGLSPAEAAMNIALPECDGRVISVPISFKEEHRYVPDGERIGRVADLALRFAVLRDKPNCDKRVAIVLSNSGGKAQKVGSAVGLDTPASLLRWLHDMRARGYTVGQLPETPDDLMNTLLVRGTYDDKCPVDVAGAWRMPRASYVRWFRAQSDGFRGSLRDAWGEPEVEGATMAPPFWRGGKQSSRSPLLALHEPHTDHENFLYSGLSFGNVVVAIQPPRGFGFDQETMYHSPDLPPCHHYAAFYRWLADVWRADALIHFGTHGTLEWLPGKSLALSADCAPDALLGDLPVFYPFVINNPGEGAQAKRRSHAVIIDHLVPPLTQADTYGPLAALSRLVEEYYRAESLDPGKLPVLRHQIWELVRVERLEDDLRQIRRERHADHVHSWDERISEQGVPRGLEALSGRGFAHLLEDLDAYLCDLGRAQIRDGLHVFAVLYSPNGSVPSLVDAVSRACGIEPRELREARGVWRGDVSPALAGLFGSDQGEEHPAAAVGSQGQVRAVVTAGQIRTAVDRLGRVLLEELAERGFEVGAVEEMLARQVGDVGDLRGTLRFACEVLVPSLARTTDETRNLLAGLDGRYVPAGPSGAPSRGMAHVLPTGRNFYTVDPRGLPTPAAWATGVELARLSLTRYFDEKGRWPEAVASSIWGTPTMRTGGDEIAQALAFLGVRPVWEPVTRRTSGLEVIPLSELQRPRIDVTLRVSGFFRDAFPALMQLFDEAVHKVIMLDEPVEQNYLRKHWLAETAAMIERGMARDVSAARATYRIFSAKPGAYGTGVRDRIESSSWTNVQNLAEVVLAWGGWAYGAGSQGGLAAAAIGSPAGSLAGSALAEGVEAQDIYRRRLAGVELALHGQDNREQDLFDSSDFFEFHGGLVAAIASVSGENPSAYFGDSSDPARPQVRTLQGEALRVFRSRVLNPKWLTGVQRHGYRGGVEMATTVDAVFGFAATAGIVTDWMFEAVAGTFAAGSGREFLERFNPWALNSIAERLLEAQQRGMWSAEPQTLESLRSVLLGSEAAIEGHA